MRKLNKNLKDMIEKTGLDIEQLPEDNLLGAQGRIIAYLISTGKLSYEQYKEMYREFEDRNEYIKVFEMAPRTFGETWLEKRILEKFPYTPGTNGKGLIKAKKKDVEREFPNYSDPLGKPFGSQFDFICFDGCQRYKVEVKACRANSEEPIDELGTSSLSSRAYSYNEAKKFEFKFHFQQIKPGFCDVFILVGVCTDKILYWILTPDELIKAGGLSPQHPTSGIKDVNDAKFEGQVYKRIDDYKKFLVNEGQILDMIIKKMH
ncbi:MAG: restriction endonuclease subunit M [Eubacterium sp.]|nr:restriction endonuclease subunit M [Eubacterium sp.]